jgi:hypothetical protein
MFSDLRTAEEIEIVNKRNNEIVYKRNCCAADAGAFTPELIHLLFFVGC